MNRYEKIARRLLSFTLVPKRAPDVAILQEIQERIVSLLGGMKKTYDGYTFIYQSYAGPDVTPNADAMKKEAEAILKLAGSNRIPNGFWGHGYFSSFSDHDSDYSREWSGYIASEGEKGFFTDRDWVMNVLAEYGGGPVEIPDAVMKTIEMFTQQSRNSMSGTTFKTPKQGAFFSFRALDLLSELKRLPDVKIEENLRRSKHNPQFHSHIEFRADFGGAATFALRIGWSGRFRNFYKTMGAEFKINPKYHAEDIQ
jgi:hypothetical protein